MGLILATWLRMVKSMEQNAYKLFKIVFIRNHYKIYKKSHAEWNEHFVTWPCVKFKFNQSLIR